MFFYSQVESKKINKQNRKKLIDPENKLAIARWERGWNDGKKGEKA